MKLKTTIYSICFCCIVVFSQNLAHAFDLSLGPKMGIGAGWFSGEDWKDQYMVFPEAETKAVFSFSLGLALDMNYYQGNVFGFGMQFEFLYVRSGGGYINDNLNVEAEYYIHAFEIPVFLKPRFKVGNGYLFMLMGPDILLSLDNKVHIKSIEGSGGGDTEVDRVYSVGLSVGLGYEFDSDPGELILYATYSTYFTGLVGNTMYNHMVHLNASYAFYLVK